MDDQHVKWFGECKWNLWEVERSIMKKFLIAFVAIVIVGFGAYDIYQTILENRKPIVEFVEESGRVSEGDRVNPYQYIAKATDYKGNNINDKKHIKAKLKLKNDDYFKYTYTIKDNEGNENIYTIKIKKGEAVSYYPEGKQQGKNELSEVKENKIFYVADYDGVTIKAMSEANLYGTESSQSFTVNPVKDENDNIIGYECVFE